MARCRRHLAVHVRDGGARAAHVESRPYVLLGLAAQGLPQDRPPEEPGERRGQRVGVAGRYEAVRGVPGGRLSRAPSTSVRSTGRPEAMASSGARAMPSQRDGRTARSAARYQGAASATAPAKTTDGGAVPRSASADGPSPTSTSRACGTRSATAGQPCSSTSWPFCRHSRPTHTTTGAVAATPGSSAARSAPEAAPANRPVSTPLWTTVQEARTPACTPLRRSASLTQITRSVQRAAQRSQRRASRAVTPSTASNDQACG